MSCLITLTINPGLQKDPYSEAHCTACLSLVTQTNSTKKESMCSVNLWKWTFWFVWGCVTFSWQLTDGSFVNVFHSRFMYVRTSACPTVCQRSLCVRPLTPPGRSHHIHQCAHYGRTNVQAQQTHKTLQWQAHKHRNTDSTAGTSTYESLHT